MSKFNSEANFLYQLFKGNSCKAIYLSMFYDCHYYLYLFICNYLCIYTPSYHHFKAFSLSKFNSETIFLYQHFKEDSNFIVKKPCKVIYLSIFYYSFITYEYMYVCMYIHTYIHIYICMYGCMHVSVYVSIYVCY